MNPGTPQFNGNQALIAAGTGLGEAMILWDGRQHRASPSEGGSADFAPWTDRELELLQFMKKRMQRVSCEETFSGRGFRKLHEFLDPAVVHSTFQDAEAASASEIAQNALASTCPVCVAVLGWWIDAFGAKAGNLALRVLAYDGAYFAGGIVLKILYKLQRSGFCQPFAEKGRLTTVLSNIPISVVRSGVSRTTLFQNSGVLAELVRLKLYPKTKATTSKQAMAHVFVHWHFLFQSR